ncbi:unnamed protein product [Gadus morhua 'NCC']
MPRSAGSGNYLGNLVLVVSTRGCSSAPSVTRRQGARATATRPGARLPPAATRLISRVAPAVSPPRPDPGVKALASTPIPTRHTPQASLAALAAHGAYHPATVLSPAPAGGAPHTASPGPAAPMRRSARRGARAPQRRHEHGAGPERCARGASPGPAGTVSFLRTHAIDRSLPCARGLRHLPCTAQRHGGPSLRSSHLAEAPPRRQSSRSRPAHPAAASSARAGARAPRLAGTRLQLRAVISLLTRRPSCLPRCASPCLLRRRLHPEPPTCLSFDVARRRQHDRPSAAIPQHALRSEPRTPPPGRTRHPDRRSHGGNALTRPSAGTTQARSLRSARPWPRHSQPPAPRPPAHEHAAARSKPGTPSGGRVGGNEAACPAARPTRLMDPRNPRLLTSDPSRTRGSQDIYATSAMIDQPPSGTPLARTRSSTRSSDTLSHGPARQRVTTLPALSDQAENRVRPSSHRDRAATAERGEDALIAGPTRHRSELPPGRKEKQPDERPACQQRLASASAQSHAAHPCSRPQTASSPGA